MFYPQNEDASSIGMSRHNNGPHHGVEGDTTEMPTGNHTINICPPSVHPYQFVILYSTTTVFAETAQGLQWVSPRGEMAAACHAHIFVTHSLLHMRRGQALDSIGCQACIRSDPIGPLPGDDALEIIYIIIGKSKSKDTVLAQRAFIIIAVFYSRPPTHDKQVQDSCHGYLTSMYCIKWKI